MIFVDSNSFDPFYNFALEEYLLKLVTKLNKPLFMLWQNKPTVVIGRYQNASNEVNQKLLREKNINLIRRSSGGGAVYHDLKNLNFSFIFNKKQNLNFEICQKMMAEALLKLNLKIDISGRNDLFLDGKKFSGLAQYNNLNASLIHGTLLFDSDLKFLKQILSKNSKNLSLTAVSSKANQVTNLKPYLLDTFTLDDLKTHLQKYFSQKQLPIFQKKFPKNKFKTWEWVWGENPPDSHQYEQKFSWGKLTVLFEIKEGKIKQIDFAGDFFSNKLLFFKEKLLNVKIETDSILKIITELETNDIFIGDIFIGSTKKEIISFFSNCFK